MSRWVEDWGLGFVFPPSSIQEEEKGEEEEEEEEERRERRALCKRHMDCSWERWGRGGGAR